MRILRDKGNKHPQIPPLAQTKHALRIKGGVLYDPDAKGFFAIVHFWDNVEMRGKPDEWRSEESFPTEAEALSHYEKNIRPGLTEIIKQTQQKRRVP